MIRRIAALLIAAAFLSGSFPPPACADSIQWIYSYEEAMKLAARLDRPVMAGFYAAWCGYCKKLDNETYADPAVAAISKDYVCMKIDVQQRRDVAYAYGVAKLPTIVFLDPSGRVMWKEFGFRPPELLAARMREILAVYRKASAANPYMAKAFDRLKQGDAEGALGVIDDAIARYHDDARLYAARGAICMSKGDIDGALRGFDESLALNPDDDSVLDMRGTAYFQKGDTAAAMADYERAISINRWSFEAYNGRGLIYLGQGDPELAVKNFNSALFINPGFVNAYANRAHAYFALKQYDKSWSDVREVELRGYSMSPEFMADLRSASGRER